MLRFYGIRAEVLLKLTKEYKTEILHEMKHWKTTQRAARWTDGNFCYLCPVRSVSLENILNMLLLTKVLMADVISTAIIIQSSVISILKKQNSLK